MTFKHDAERREEQLKAEIARLRGALRNVRNVLINTEDEINTNLTITPEDMKK